MEKIPPHNLEAESSLLGAMLIENSVISEVAAILQPEDFYRSAYQKVFSAIVSLFLKNEPADVVTITEYLKNTNQLEEMGGISLIASLAERVASAANAVNYAKIVKEKSIIRGFISTTTKLINEGYEGITELDDFLDKAERAVFGISEDKIKPSFYPVRQVLGETIKKIEERYAKKEIVTGVPTGFKDFDMLTSGLQSSDLIIIAARPSMGKTALALNIAEYAAIEHEIPVAFFSLEMAKEQLVTRMLSSIARVNSQNIRNGFLTEKDWAKLGKASDLLARSPIFIDDSGVISVLEIRAKARRLKASENLGLLIIDYLQLVKGRSGTERREQEISEISRSLKALAKDLNIPIIALSQLNRQPETRPGGKQRPQLADLRESGAIEQDADLIAFIYREEVYYPDKEEAKNTAEIIIGKQRNGPQGVVKLYYSKDFTRFEGLAKE